MDYFTDLLATFLDLDRVRSLAVYGRVRELSDSIKNILICVLKMNGGFFTFLGELSFLENHCHLPQSAAASRNATWISVTLGESYTSILSSDAAGFSGPELISDSQKDSENVCCTQMSPHFNLFPGKMDFEFSVPKTKGTIQTFISDRSKSKCLSWYGGAAEQTAWVTGIFAKVPLTWRHILGLYRDIYYHQDDVVHGKSMVIMSRQCQVSFCMCYNSMVS